MSIELATKLNGESEPARRLGKTAPVELLSLRRNFSWTLAGNTVYGACRWGMLVVLAKVGSPEDVGVFGLAVAVTTPIMMFTNLELRQVLATDARRRYQFGDYLALRLLTTPLGLLVTVAIVFFGGYRSATGLVILAWGAAKAVESISDILYGLLQQHERMDRIARLQIVKGPLLLGAMGVTMFLTGSVLWSVVAVVAVQGLMLAGYDFRNVLCVQPKDNGGIRPCWHLSTLMKLAWLALPLGFAMMLTSFGMSIPRYFVEHYLGMRELGILVAIAYFIVVGTMVTGALAQSALPRLARYYVENKIGALRRVTIKAIAMCAVVGILGTLGLLVAGRSILTIVYTPEYAEHWDVLFWLALGLPFRLVSNFLGTLLRGLRVFRTILLVRLGSVAVLLALNVFLVAGFGLVGAAWAITASTIFDVAVYAAITGVLLRRCKHWEAQNPLSKPG